MGDLSQCENCAEYASLGPKYIGYCTLKKQVGHECERLFDGTSTMELAEDLPDVLLRYTTRTDINCPQRHLFPALLYNSTIESIQKYNPQNVLELVNQANRCSQLVIQIFGMEFFDIEVRPLHSKLIKILHEMHSNTKTNSNSSLPKP